VSFDRLKFEAMIRHARAERIPAIDVVDKVADRIRILTTPDSESWPLWGAVGVSVTAAIVVLCLAIQQGALLEDPLANWLRPLIVGMK